MRQFFGVIGQVISYILLALGFAVYLKYSRELDTFTFILAVLLIYSAIIVGFGRSYLKFRRFKSDADREGIVENDVLVDTSARARLFFDLTTWLTASTILSLPLLTLDGLMAMDIIQTTIAIIGLSICRRIILSKHES